MSDEIACTCLGRGLGMFVCGQSRSGQVQCAAMSLHCVTCLVGALLQFEQHATIKFIRKLGKSTLETLLAQNQVYVDNTLEKKMKFMTDLHGLKKGRRR